MSDVEITHSMGVTVDVTYSHYHNILTGIFIQEKVFLASKAQGQSRFYISLWLEMFIKELTQSHDCTIRKYGSTFYVGMGHVKNGHLNLRYGSSSKKTTAK